MPSFEPAIDAIREAMPSIQQSIETAFANVEMDPGVSLHVTKDAVQAKREENREKARNPNGQPGDAGKKHGIKNVKNPPGISSPANTDTQQAQAFPAVPPVALTPPKPRNVSLYFSA